MKSINPNKAKNLETLFPILAVDAETDIIVSKNADLTVAFEMKVPEIFAISDSEYDTLHDVLVRAIKILPIGYMIHKQDMFIEDDYNPNFESEFLQSNNYVAWENERHFAERPYLRHRCYLYITRPASSPLKRTSQQSSLLKRHLVPKEIQDPKTWIEFTDIVNQFEATFNDSGKVTLNKLNKDEILGTKTETGLFQKYFSLSFDDEALYDLETKDGLKVAGNTTYTYAITELNDFPNNLQNSARLEQFSTDSSHFPISTGSTLGMMLSCNHVYNQALVVCDGDAMVNEMVGEVRRHYSFSAWSKENEVSISAKDAFMEEVKANNRKVVKAHFNVMVFHRDPEIADNYRSLAAAAISKLGFKPKLATWDAETLFWACIPGNISEIGTDNLATCFLEEATAIWNVETNYQDGFFNKNGVLLTDRFGRPCMVDPFFAPLEKGLISNRNFMVIGPSGSGKSFTMNNIIYYLLSHGVHISMVDVGHSYKRLCKLMGGRYITYETDNPINFNPFYMKDLNPDEETKDALANLLMALWKKDGERSSKSEEVTISSIVHEYYVSLRRNRNDGNDIFPCFDSFYEFTQNKYPDIFKQNQGRSEKEFDLQNFLYVLRPYYKGGQYDYLLNSRQNIDLMDLPFVIYELDNIKDHPVLFPVTTIMIMNTYVRKLFSVKGVLKMLVIEEAWKALAKDSFSDFLRWCSKTVRKHYGSLGVVTQEVDDLVGNAIVKDAIINNSPIKFLLDQSNYEKRFGEIMQTLALSEKQANIILSINKGKNPNRPPYKELALLLGDYCKVYGVEVSKTAYGTFTTERREVEEIQDLAQNKYNGNLENAVKAWANGERTTVFQP
ncbi:TraG family conjugative transposon ATPase [Runella slithyformis]|uniref:Bacteroides conjugation system ATPase, TraG family n=1 Tax=Runella slithyformis (strain ATCC 29530 / DSM 19594 / LMG 11500 / NCIMB 11436 / LSU 4) TaxID=761193 RepID=A0A7U4E911_RUNSL|nr:TraG family conjugative transposon ATPase [Runella slithyformis]AEI52029.1 Bacteroides conjugation system ATPase, TraG family [Runella slithyformis DSM 19594]